MGQSPDSSSYNEEKIGLPLIQGNADIKDGFSAPKRYTSKPTKICDAGDILLTVRAPVGDVSIASEKSCIGRGVCSIKAEKYIYYFLQSKEKHWKKIAQGSTFTCISSDDVTKLLCNWPNQNARKKTELFLTKIDERIITQNKIIKKYESLIKPLFDSLNKGPKHPVTIGELGKYVSADSLSWDSINDCGNPVIIYGQLFTDYKYIIREVISRTDAILKTVTHGNDLLFPSSTTVDALSLIAPASIKLHNVFLGGDMFKIEMDIAKFDSDYISFLIICSYKEELAKYAQGSTIIHLHYDDIKSFKINICDIEEQKKISNALNLLLDKITVEKRLLELLRIQRRYLLGNMFI